MRQKTRTLTQATTTILIVAVVAMGLMTFGLLSGRWQGAPVLTGSMSPAISPGALIIARSGPVDDLRVGDVIVFHAPTAGRPVTVHRVAQLDATQDGLMVTTKGDANEEVDPWGPFQLTDQRVWTVSRVVPGLGRAILAVRNPVAQFLGLILLAVASAWLFTEDRARRRPTLTTRPATVTPASRQGATPPATGPPPPTAQTTPRTHRADSPVRGNIVPSQARIDLDGNGRPVSLWINLDTSMLVSVGGDHTVPLDPPAGVTAAPGRDDRPRSDSARRGKRLGNLSVGALVIVGVLLGASAAEATFRSEAADDLVVITSSSLEPPTRLSAEVAFALGSCDVTLDWTFTTSERATGYEILRQPLEAAPLTDLESSGTYEPTGPFEVVGTVDGRRTETAVDILPDDAVQANTGFRYALRSTRDDWTSNLSESVDVTALGVCLKVEPPASPAPTPTLLPEPVPVPDRII